MMSTTTQADPAGRTAPLAGLRVLDFSRFLSGPHCTRALSDLGADVVKVETPDGDFTRSIPPHAGAFSRFYVQQNAGKRNICLDLRKSGASELIKRLLPATDVLVENFRPGVMETIGVGYQACRAVNPRLVYASISGWGQDGPDSNRAAFAIVIHAESGIAIKHLQLHRFDQPVSDVFNHADVYAGLETVAAVLAALYQREHTGEGQHIDVAMMSTALAINELASAGFDPEWPSDYVNRAPILRFHNDHVALAADPVEPVSYGRLAAALGPRLTDDPRFVDEASRAANREALVALMQEWISGFATLQDLERALAAIRIPIGVVRSVVDVAASPWAKHRNAIVEVPDRQGGSVPIPNAPWKFSGGATGVSRGPAWRGEHNHAVLAEAGFTSSEIAALRHDGVLLADNRAAAATSA